MAGDAPHPVVPAPLDRAALERVLKRAAELQTANAEPSDAIVTEDRLLEIGREVGLSPQHLRQALAEERTRVTLAPETGTMAHLFGASHVSATRTVRGTPSVVLSALDQWMQREECLRVKRQFPERVLWEEQRGIEAMFRRNVNLGGRDYTLARALEVAATAIPVDAERVLVRLDADFTNVRTQRLVAGVGVATGGALSTGVLIALGFAVPFAAIPAAVLAAGGYFLARSNTPFLTRAQLALEQVLDRLERGELTRDSGSLLSAIAATTRLLR